MRNLFVIALMAFAFASCNSEDGSDDPMAHLIENSKPLFYWATNVVDNPLDMGVGMPETFEYSINKGKHGEYILHVLHKNMTCNVASDKIGVLVHDGKDGSIHIHEKENRMDANGIRQHDVSYDIPYYGKGKYSVSLYHDVVTAEESSPYFQFDLEVNYGVKGSFVIAPAGVMED